jgi:hypothetical protein
MLFSYRGKNLKSNTAYITLSKLLANNFRPGYIQSWLKFASKQGETQVSFNTLIAEFSA